MAGNEDMEFGYGPWTAIAGADWDLDEVGGDIKYLRDIQAKFTAHADARVKQLVVESISPRQNYRVDTAVTNTHLVYEADELEERGVSAIGQDGIVLAAASGIDWPAGLDADLDAAEAVITGLQGPLPRWVAFPNHIHDLDTILYLMRRGYLGARDGSPGTDVPEGHCSDVFGHYHNENWRKGWDLGTPFELPLRGNSGNPTYSYTAADVQAAAANKAAQLALLEGADRLPRWIADHSWVQIYTHNAIDAAHFAAMLQAWLEHADDDLWICTLTEGLEHFRRYHHPSHDARFWVPKQGFEADGPYFNGRPWNGRRAAITFSTDDGDAENYSIYWPQCVLAGGVKFSMALITSVLDGVGKISSAQLVAMMRSGLVDVGVHTHNNINMVNNQSLRIRNPGGYQIGLEIYTAGTRHMKLYDRSLLAGDCGAHTFA